MELLQYFYTQPLATESYLPRKGELPEAKRINLHGVRGSGKSVFLFNHLSQLEKQEVLYIDCQDPNLTFTPLQSPLIEEFVEKNSISLLVLDHYYVDLLERFPKSVSLIVVTLEPLGCEGFESLALFPLDYEEFLLFERGGHQGTSFKHFLKLGTLPMMARSPKSGTLPLRSFFFASFDAQERSLLTLLALYQTKHMTIHQIYTFAKERLKISKDWLYRTIKRFEREGVIFFIDDIYQKGGKKLVLFDFAFGKYLSQGQPFMTQFDTMVALWLIKNTIPFSTIGIHGYALPNGRLVIPAPFESEESIWKKSHTKFSLYREFGITEVIIVTVANQYRYEIKGISFEAMPFYEWSIVSDGEW